jgi:hypothetical protein
MKATIKISKVGKFDKSDLDALRRISNVLQSHNMSVKIEIKVKQQLKLKTA